MKSKRIFAVLLSITMLLLLTTSNAYATDSKNSKLSNQANQTNVATTIRDQLITENLAYYNSFTGTVKKITEYKSLKGFTYLLVVNEEGAIANIILSNDTYRINDEKISIGSVITGYYEAKAMIMMIYPPRYYAEVIMVTNKEQNRKVDYFDKELISADRTLKLNISKETEIILKDGTTFQGELAYRRLLVFYDITTKSIPAQTTPSKVVVLSEPEKPDDDKQSYYGSFTGIVKEMTSSLTDKGVTKVLVENEAGTEAYFTISKDTYRVNNEKIIVGSAITGYFDAKAIRIMIYPPHYFAEVVVVTNKEHNVKVDYFDKELISADRTLKLNISKETEIILKDGTVYDGSLANKRLVVIYDTVCKCLPPQTIPIKVIVLSLKEEKYEVYEKAEVMVSCTCYD